MQPRDDLHPLTDEGRASDERSSGSAPARAEVSGSGPSPIEDALPDTMPGLARALPPTALALSVLSLIVATTASLVWPDSLESYSALVWLLAIVPAFLFAYYKGWKGSATVLITTMLLLAVLDIGMALFTTGQIAWWLIGGVVAVLMAVTLGAGLTSEAFRRRTAAALQLAYADPLTSLPNRRILRMFLAKEFASFGRGRHVAIVLFDIDGFKKINDTLGHQAGDQALCRVAEVLGSNTRGTDLSGRYGGDEFLALLPGEGVKGAVRFANRVREAVASFEDADGHQMTLSCGVAISNSATQSDADLIRVADLALYTAKREGGNRAVVGSPYALEDTVAGAAAG